ncbi:MAG: hypothetical protein KDD25_10505, partial [Bdellovibrionales bacterium]|nr:hypothetical protein [Bdellovibrionales bacterium]
LFSRLEVSALSVDWRHPISEISNEAKKYGRKNLTFQGNIDPIVMTLDFDKTKKYVDLILNDVKKSEIRERFIFNVGHGFTPHTNTETVKRVVDYVHEFSI